MRDNHETKLIKPQGKLKSGYRKVASFDTYDTEYSHIQEEEIRARSLSKIR